MTDIQNFQFGSKEIRVIDQEGESWFVARDVAEILEYRSTNDATRLLDEDEKGAHKVRTLGGEQEVTIINESGLYSLALRSNKPEAKVFKKWVTSEVLPAIRKHGGYLTQMKTEELIANPDLIIEMAQSLKLEREKRKQAERLAQRNEEIIALQDKVMIEVQPKVQYYEDVLAADDGILTNVIAKELDMSAPSLNRRLKHLGVIYKQGDTWVLYQKHQGKNYTKSRTYTFVGSDGKPRTSIQTVWTQKGREFIHSLIKKD